jgi:outer membrane immunogenic protein
MRRIVFALACALSVGTIQSASAADIPAPIYKAPPATVVVRNWTGCYIGGNGGYGWGHKDFISVAGVDLGSHTADGWVVGGQVGCDYQTGPWVFGVRGMFDWADMTGSHIGPTGTAVFNTRVRSFETAVGRAGYTISPNTLVYALGGFAWVQDRHWITTVTPGDEIGNANVTRTGYTVGAGLEHMFAPSWSAFIEYDYIHCGCVIPITPVPGGSLPLPPVLGGSTEVDIKQNVSLILVGVNYRFAIQ